MNALTAAFTGLDANQTTKREELTQVMEKRIHLDVKASEEKLGALIEATRGELEQNITDVFARGAKKIRDELREELESGVKLLRKEIASVLHISGKYDMELRPDLARTRGYSRTLGEHIAKAERANQLELDDIKDRLTAL